MGWGGVGGVAGRHVFEQVGDDHRVLGASVNDLFMDPSGPSWPSGILQTDARGKERRMGRSEDVGKGRSDLEKREKQCDMTVAEERGALEWCGEGRMSFG